MADREDFATEVGQLIKGRSPVGHSHTSIENEISRWAINSSGAAQLVRRGVDGAPDVEVLKISTGGELIVGTVPTARIPGLAAEIAKRGPQKCLHLEAGKWVWDGPNSTTATHYLIPDHTGALIARPTPHPVPDATPSLTW